MTNRNPVVAFFLSFIPGAGFLYLDRKFRGLFYGIIFFCIVGGGLFIAIVDQHGETFVFSLLLGAVILFIQLFDMVLLLLKQNHQAMPIVPLDDGVKDEQHPVSQVNHGGSDQFLTLFLAFIPGLGHFHLGLMNRGLAFLLSFFGSIMMVLFITVLTHQEGFLIFLGVVAVIWIFNLFDIVQLLKRKGEGEVLEDRTVLEDLEKHRESGKKSRTFAMLLGIFPGAGHMYLGMQKRGLQLMAGFLFAIYLIDFMRISLFMFFIPLIWFFSFFDAMQKASRVGKEELEDVPIVSYLVNKQKWIGVGLVLLGFYYLFDRVIKPELFPWLSEVLQVDMNYIYYHYFQVTVVCLLLIGGGLKLMLGSKKKGDDVS